jgi:predicted RNA methylase
VSGFDLFGDVALVDDGQRNAYDYYPTPGFMTRSLLHFHPAIEGAWVLEPCAGNGAIANVLRDAGCGVYENDIDPRHRRPDTYDATAADYWSRMQRARCDWVITNPPFNVALQIGSSTWGEWANHRRDVPVPQDR